MLEELTNLIKQNRPKLSVSSINTYVSTLKNLYFQVYPADKLEKKIDISKFYNHKDFIDYLSDVPSNKRKSILSALISLCVTPEQGLPYRKIMFEDIKVYNDEQVQQVKNENEEKNWINQDQLKTIFNEYKDMSMKIMKISIKKEITNGASYASMLTDIQYVQNFIILCLTSGLFIPPRRSLDWVAMIFDTKPQEADADVSIQLGGHNIYTNLKKNSKFVFVKYKTNSSFNVQEIAVPADLNDILQLWIKFISKFYKGNYLLFDSNGNKLTPVKLNQRLNKIFGGKISVNALRHSFITEKYVDKPMPPLAEILDTATAMAHNPITHLKYIKK